MSGSVRYGKPATRAPDHIERSTWALLVSLYITQSAGLMFFMIAFVAIVLEQGASMGRVSLIYAVGMVWPFKFLWAPFIDRFHLGKLGHYRGWLILMQSSLVLVLVALAHLDLNRDFDTIYLFCLLIAFLSATQDIATDGLACRILPAEQRGIGNGLQITGGLLGTLLGGGAILITYPHVGWYGSMFILAGVTAISLVQVLVYRESRWPVIAVSTQDFVIRLWTFWRQPGRGLWLAVVLLYTTSSSLAYALVIPILMELGWTLEHVGWVVNIFGSLVGCLSAISSGWAIRRLGRRHALIWAAVLQIAGVLAVALLLVEGSSYPIATVAVGVYFLCYNPAAVILSTMMMDHASPTSPATDYTTQYSANQFFALGSISVGAALAVPLGYGGVLALAAIAAVLAVTLACVYRGRSPLAAAGNT